MPYSTTDIGMLVYEKDASGLAIRATLSSGTPPTTTSLYATGCDLTALDTGLHYRNEGTSTTPNWVIN
jgi:hypothetical protein